ncbi:MAG TPA: phosphate ABC transporter substrate-binding protein [Blastocatellia bacterium]
MRSILQIALVALLLSGITSCAHRSPQYGGAGGLYGNSIAIKGSDTMVLLAQWWAENYMKSHPYLIIQVNGGGSGAGIAALLNGTTDICQSSRPIKEEESDAFRRKYQRDVVEIKVALDAIGVYVNEANPARELSLQQARDIYTGKITDWREVGGAPGPIILYSRENNSGTYEFFKEHVLKNADFAPRAQTLSGNAAVVNAVSQDRNGIGYGGISFVKGVKALPIRKDAASAAVFPDFASVADGSYPISRFLYWYLPNAPEGEVKRLVDWVTSDEGQALVKEVGYFPIGAPVATAFEVRLWMPIKLSGSRSVWSAATSRRFSLGGSERKWRQVILPANSLKLNTDLCRERGTGWTALRL